MQHKLTLAVGALFLSLAAAIQAAPLLETRDVAELLEARDLLPESDLQERSILDLSDEEDLVTRDFDDDLDARDFLDDPLEELAIRGPARAAQNKKKAEKQKAAKQAAKADPAGAAAKKAARETDRIAKGLPKPGSGKATSAPKRAAPIDSSKPAGPHSKANSLKGAAMTKHIADQRKLKNDAKNAQRGAGYAGSKKEAKATERKENRAAAKLQHQRATVGKGTSQMKWGTRGFQGKIVHKNTPDSGKQDRDRATRKANGKLAYDALSGDQKAARAAAQTAKVAADKLTAGDRRTARSDAKKAATAARKAERQGQITHARAEYKKSMDTGTFPGRTTNFNTPQGKHYTGRDVRQALFAGHAAAHNGKGVGYDAKTGKQEIPKFRHPKAFENRDNSDSTKPLPAMAGTGREFGMLSGKKAGYDGRSPNPTEARLITQANGTGAHEFKGVVAHPAGSDDHVNVPGTR